MRGERSIELVLQTLELTTEEHRSAAADVALLRELLLTGARVATELPVAARSLARSDDRRLFIALAVLGERARAGSSVSSIGLRIYLRQGPPQRASAHSSSALKASRPDGYLALQPSMHSTSPQGRTHCVSR